MLTAARALRAVPARRRPDSPAALAARIIPGYRITPALAMISDALADAVANPGRRYIITCPPRTGKSVLVSQVGPTFALMHAPDAPVILTSYADSLAQFHSRHARKLVEANAELLGFGLAPDKSAVGRWEVDGRDGSLLAAGILSGITGHGAQLLLLDDVVKNAEEADSKAIRERITDEFHNTLMTRLMPGGSVVIVGTRWHPKDLIGTLLDTEGDRWRHINIPAVAEAGVPDALGRQPGVAMTSALGFTAEDYAELRLKTATRTWAAMYLGVPASPEGNLIQRGWIDARRLIAAPWSPTLTVVGIDPAESGEGDQTGIVGAMLGRDGTVALTHDVSAKLTSDAWCNRAVELAVQIGASQIHFEGYAAATSYARMLREAVEAAHPPHPITVAEWRGKGDALARAQGLIGAVETGRCRVAGTLPGLESDMVGWQAGQHCPDSVAAAVVCYESLRKAAGQRIHFGVPGVAGLASGDVASVLSLQAYLSRKVVGR